MGGSERCSERVERLDTGSGEGEAKDGAGDGERERGGTVHFSFVCDAMTPLLYTWSPIHAKDLPYYSRIYPYFPLFSIPCFLPVAVELYSL